MLKKVVLEFTESYIPETFPHRENHLSSLRNVFENFKKFGYTGENLLLLGTSGAGKTSLTKKVLEENKGLWIFASGAEDNTAHKILLKLADVSNKKTSSDIFEILCKNLTNQRKVIVIDEVHKVKDIENLVNFINELFRRTNVPIIFITNRFTFVQAMPRDAQLTLFFNKVDFGNYDASQLYDILKDRLNRLISRTSTPYTEEMDSMLRFVCAKVVTTCDSSARIALDMVKKSVLSNNFSHDFVNKYLFNMQEQSWQNFVHNLNTTEKRMLQAMIELTMDKEEVSSSDLHENLKDLNLTPGRISQLITIFIEDYDILNARWENLGGKHGRYRLIKFKSPFERNLIISQVMPPSYQDYEPEWYNQQQEEL